MRPEPTIPRDAEPAPRRAAGGAPRRVRWPILAVGIVFIALGLVSLGYVGWQYYGTNLTANKAMGDEIKQLRAKWSDAAPQTQNQTSTTSNAAPNPEGTFALLRIPKLGADYVKPIVSGTEAEQLGKGVGWYTFTAHPGQVGNFAIAGHRITHGEPFARLLELNVGDKVEVETREATYVYELTTAPREITVNDTQGGWVLEPRPAADPSKRGAKPSEALITLTTCTDLFASPDRSVGFGKLVETKRK